MKKKILALALVAILAVTAIAGASLAYLTDKDEAVNVMTLGNVDIQQNERDRFGSDFAQKLDCLHIFAFLRKLTGIAHGGCILPFGKRLACIGIICVRRFKFACVQIENLLGMA